MKLRFFGRPLFAWREGPLYATEHEYLASQRIAVHIHEQPYICIVTRGGYRERTPRGVHDCRRSTMLLHPAGTRHSDEFFPSASRCLMVEVDAGWLARVAGPGAFSAPVIATCGPLHVLGGRFEAELRIRDEMTSLSVHGLLLETVAAASRTEHDSPLWLRRVTELLRDNPNHAHTLEALAKVAGVHATHVARTFRARLGCSVGEFVRRLRVDRAKEAIAAGMGLAETAAACGFSDQSHLTRTFRRLVGSTPAAFRRALRAD